MMNKLKVISLLASILAIIFLSYFIFNMPALPQRDENFLQSPNLEAFYADTSHLRLAENIHISSAKKYEGKYYISDAIAKKVYCIDENSNILWESKGLDKFILPNLKFPLDIGEDGSLWVANTGKLSLEQLDINTGKFIASWQPKEKIKGCCNPIAILVLSEGRFLAMEKGVNLLKMYYPDGSSKSLAKLNANWQNYELRKFEAKVEYCDGLNMKTIDIE